MSRWHKSSCHSPRVSIEDGLPHCQSCDISPNIQKLVSEQASLSPPWSVPPDESFGEMNLSWPESVLYSPQIRDTTSTDAGEAKETKDLGRQHEPPHIYNKKLGNNEFRLIYLPAVDDESRPIHASLEAYQIDDCPEYETVSYCWGGENGDTTLCKPVFLGDYWDILFQTQNCWSMLHYLRPRIGVRTFWVDAICINQMDHQERESQVAIMDRIYQQCRRAVVYLGQDVVRPGSNSNRTYPARRDLNTESASAVDLRHLLKMRYFQRVWVVQELVLAPMVIIPVNGVELTARRHAATEVAWHDSDAPWMRHICTGQSGTALRVILEQTLSSQSTDIRDKIFGLLGFLPGSQGLRPNYSLSSLHIYIGTIAYILLNEGHSNLLMEAPGHQAPPTVPSWLPDGNLSNIGVLLRKLASPASMSISREERHFWDRLLALNPGWETLLRTNLYESKDKRGSPQQEFKALETWLPALEKPSIHPSTSALSLPLIFLLQFSSRPKRLHWDGSLISCFEITVSNCTIYIRTSDDSLDSVIEPGPTSIFLFKNITNSPLLLFMRRSDPDANYRLLKCCPCSGIFLSRQPPSKSTFPSIPQVESPDPDFDGNDPAWSPDHYEDWDDPAYSLDDPSYGDKPYPAFKRGCSPIWFNTVYDIVSEAQDHCNRTGKTLETMRTKGHPLDRDIVIGHRLGLFYRLSISSDGPFVDSYFNFLQQCSLDCSVEIEESGKERWVWVTMNPKDWLAAHASLNNYWDHEMFTSIHLTLPSPDEVGPWFWARVPESSDSIDIEVLDTLEIDYPSTTHRLSAWTYSHRLKRYPATVWERSRTVTMVAKEEGLRQWLKRSPYFRLFPKLRVCSRLVGEDEMALGTAAPKPEYSSICYYDWPECFFDGEHIPGKQENISIF